MCSRCCQTFGWFHGKWQKYVLTVSVATFSLTTHVRFHCPSTALMALRLCSMKCEFDFVLISRGTQTEESHLRCSALANVPRIILFRWRGTERMRVFSCMIQKTSALASSVFLYVEQMHIWLDQTEEVACLLLSGTIRGNFFTTAVSSCIMVSICSVLRRKQITRVRCSARKYSWKYYPGRDMSLTTSK